MTEWNLSDKIISDIPNNLFPMRIDPAILKVEDVREFIKRLKEQIYQQERYNQDHGNPNLIPLQLLKHIIDKLAGEALI